MTLVSIVGILLYVFPFLMCVVSSTVIKGWFKSKEPAQV